MMDIVGIFTGRAWQSLVAALLHTLWQGAILATLLAAALRSLPSYRPGTRYLLALAAQFVVLLAGLLTWSVLEYRPARPGPWTMATAGPVGRVAAPVPERSALAEPLATSGVDATRGDDGASPWTSVVAAAWLLGVALMLLRTAASVGSAAGLARAPRVGDPAVLAMVGRIREALRIGRPIRVVEVAADRGPAVLGVLWPTLLLPAAAISGLPPDALQALLIHELAHIRRYDYLVNIAQMLVESVLFFNPAVWWIGRQARLEREACCDATAVRLTGRPLEYTRSLAEWAGRSRGAAVAAAWAGDRRPGTLLERVRRVLRPSERPAARVSPSGLLLLMLGGPVLLGLLYRGTSAAVGLAAQVLSPAERIERLKATQAEYAPPMPDVDGQGRLKGTIRTADGKEAARPIWLYHSTDRPGRGGIMGTLAQVRSEFSVEVPAGTTWLTAAPDDYAPFVVGPFTVRPGQTIEGISIVLEAGFPAKIAVFDRRGVPVSGARVSAHRLIDGKGSVGAANGWITDDNGVAIISHAVEQPYNVSVQARGYEPLESVRLTPSAGQTKVVTVKPSRPARGVAVDPQGKPVVGAEVRLYLERSENSSHMHGQHGPVLATTDEAGRFTLDTLKEQPTYLVLVKSKAGGLGLSPNLRAGQDGIRVTVGPKLAIKGKVMPSAGVGVGPRVPAAVTVIQFLGADPQQPSTYPLRTRVTVDRDGRFAAGDLFPCETEIEVDGRIVPVHLDGPETSVRIEPSRPAPRTSTRRVVLRVAAPDGAVAATGAIVTHTYKPGDRMPAIDREVPLEGGRAVVEAPVSAHVWYQSHALVGYWFKDGDVAVEPGDGDQVVDIPAAPAGAIAGQVLDGDGKPAVRGVDVSCRTVEPAPGLRGEVFMADNVRVGAEGRFFLSPLPLGGAYAVNVSRGHNRQVSPPLRLDGSNPTARITLTLAHDAVAEGRVVGPDGRPLAGVPVTLELVHPTAGGGWAPPTPTDDRGRFRFDDLNPDLDGYRAIVDARKDYQPAEVRLRPGGPLVSIRLRRGHRIEGRVVDAKTGRPIPGVTVYARRPEWIPGERNLFEAESKTDDQGRFRFSNLPDGAWHLGDRDGLEWESPHKTHAFGVDGPDPVEIRAVRPVRSDR
jgi:beta-lactamase regulating signal transducer with metallopeptidase domain